jgi:hypothetical protein
MELSVGIEYDNLNPEDGYYVESGRDVQDPGAVDFTEFDGLSWITLDASVVYHKPLNAVLALRYGGGIGLSYVMGDVIKTDAICNGPNAQTDCQADPNAQQLNEKQDFFRFPPVLNLLAGLQITPGDNLAINLEFGMRTVFYGGTSVQYFF